MTRRWAAASSTTLGCTGTTHRGSITVAPIPCAQALGDLDRELRHRADADEQNILGVAPQHVRAVGEALECGQIGRDGTLREPDDGGRVVDGDRLGELLAQPGLVARGGDADAGDELQHRGPTPWWLGPSGPVTPDRSRTKVTPALWARRPSSPGRTRGS
jgi:hypothetical protein